ncbi:MAG: D-3-phosphoglycerate dehydrogenase [Maribacter sp.]|jgi:D-3-phosphoglycerate dehydrogenase
MIRILANDGIHADGKLLLEEAGYEVDTNKIPQDELMTKLNDYDVIIIRSATKVRKDLIDACPNLKIIARAGVGIDNIDHEYARSIGREVINTPAASSQSVAELTFAHIFSLSRYLFDSNRNMPAKGESEFKSLKKSYSKGMQLRGRTIGIIGFGRIGQEVARIALGLGMRILPVDPYSEGAAISLEAPDQESMFTVNIRTVEMDDMLAKADFITVHVPGGNILGTEEIAKMKDGVRLINTSRGGVIDEDALLAGIESGKIAGAGIDVFVGEPTPRKEMLENSRISLTPHIGASTLQAQSNIGLELADKILAFFGDDK